MGHHRSPSTSPVGRREGPKSWKEVMDEAKKRHRPRLKDWSLDGFATHRAKDFLALSRLTTDPQATVGTGQVEVVDSQELSVADFITRFEEPCKPVVIRRVPEEEQWGASQRWRLPDMAHLYNRYGFKCGEDDDGRSVRVRLPEFYQYMLHQTDDSPLYIFDSTYDDDKEACALLDDYRIPSYFPDDFFSLVGERRRPPYRWFLVGPQRSGTCVHVDPLGTSAWNTVITGKEGMHGHMADVVKGKALYKKGEDDEPINYFVDIVRRMRRSYRREVAMYEFIQEPGETVFVPGGWWHAVLNLEDSLAITQNFCSRTNFSAVWRKTRSGRKKMAVKWLERLECKYPELAQQAKQLNEEDHYQMMTREELDERKARKIKKKKERREKKRRRKREDEKPRDVLCQESRGDRRRRHERRARGELHEDSKEPENDRFWRQEEGREHSSRSRPDTRKRSRSRPRSRSRGDVAGRKRCRERDRSGEGRVDRDRSYRGRGGRRGDERW